MLSIKDINIKIWPELIDMVPAIIPLQSPQLRRMNNIVYDLSNVRNVTSSGLVLALLGLIKIAEEIDGQKKWRIEPPNDSDIGDKIQKLGLNRVLDVYQKSPDLFWSVTKPVPIPQRICGCRVTSYPIYILDYISGCERRSCIQDFVEWLFSIFEDLENDYIFNLTHLIPILQEIAKNSADHTSGNAYFGIDFIYESISKQIRLNFAFIDTGIGINQTIAKFVQRDPAFKNKEGHLSLSDAYHYALGSGNTTKPLSGSNRGLGMSIIYDMARALDLNLSVFDANSRGILTLAKNKTHAELRKVFYNVGHKVGFSYFGELLLPKRP